MELLGNKNKWVITLNELEYAAKSGDADSQFNLGWRYRKGDGVTQDDREAAYWYLKAANQGHPMALNNLGMFYMNGLGDCGPDMDEAYRYYKAAADKGHKLAMNNLAGCYATGSGVDQDLRKAFELCLLAAELGDDDSQAKIGLHYLKGDGVPQNYEIGVLWLKKAAAQGYEPAINMLNTLNNSD